jgi:DNA polymerase-3 subunit delta
MLLAEFLGNDLSRIANELEKLSILVERGTTINDIHIEENIGISKDYNGFELTNAIAKKDSVKAMKIVQYFEYNPKAIEFPNLINTLFKHFSQLMRIHFSPVKTKEAIAQSLGLHQFIVGELMISKNLYDPKKIASVIALLHTYDLKFKGVGSANATNADLLKELVFQIIH